MRWAAPDVLSRTGSTDERLKNACEYFTGAACFHFVVPVFVNAAVANRTVDKPAEIAAFKFPGRTLLFLIGRTVFQFPARFAVFRTVAFP